MVIWIIGLSGAGKTTLAKETIKRVRKTKSNIILIDGDMIRDTFNNDLGHSLEDRRKNADRICRLCKYLDDQGVHVVCSILSLFPESRKWNREFIRNYFEVYIDAPIDQLKHRDYKGLYKKFQNGEIKNIAGLDIDFKMPSSSDLRITNDSSLKKLKNNSLYLSKIICESIP
ncbi:MAG: adenylyl-sulfate kinase [Candidatus Marinimicrobia bacterium]|nr:adenylyl-sulfate kinase [Candidatus Neomarinimicrobiota bacterium]